MSDEEPDVKGVFCMSIFRIVFLEWAESPLRLEPILCFAKSQAKFILSPVFELPPLFNPSSFPACSVLGSGYLSMKLCEA